MKNYFFTGLAVLLPLTITLLLITTLFNLLTEPFAGFVSEFLPNHYLIEHAPKSVQHIVSQVVILLLLIGFIFLLGILGRWFFVNQIIHYSESFVRRIPFISSLYKMSKDVTKTLFTVDQNSFKQVVLAPYPSEDTYCIGLVTNDSSYAGDERLSVFVPCTVNPSSGFLLMLRKDQLIFLDMKVEEALKYLISCGVIQVPLRIAEEVKP